MVYSYHPHTGRFEQSTRSTVRASTVGPYVGSYLSRRSYDDDVLYRPSRMPLYHRPYDTTGNEYATHGQINRELIMSTSAMEDNYDITNRSRARDREVLTAANRAIVDTELHSSPKYAVAARRAARGQSTPPSTAYYSRSEVLVARARAGPNFLRYSVPPAFSAPKRQPKSRIRFNVNPRYRNRVPVRSARFVVVKPRDRSPDTEIEEQRRAPLSLLSYLRSLQVAHLNRNRIARPRYKVPFRPAFKKAALLGSKVEALMPERKRRPKSSYAQARVRNLERERRVSGEPEAPVFVGETTSLKAHTPVRWQHPRHIWGRELFSYRLY